MTDKPTIVVHVWTGPLHQVEGPMYLVENSDWFSVNKLIQQEVENGNLVAVFRQDTAEPAKASEVLEALAEAETATKN